MLYSIDLEQEIDKGRPDELPVALGRVLGWPFLWQAVEDVRDRVSDTGGNMQAQVEKEAERNVLLGQWAMATGTRPRFTSRKPPKAPADKKTTFSNGHREPRFLYLVLKVGNLQFFFSEVHDFLFS